MLDALRRHASSWVIKVVLGLIILSFALFFGYNQIESQRIEAERLIALVGDHPVTRQEFDARYEDEYQRVQESLKGEVGADLEGLLRQTILQRLIAQEVASLYATSLGIVVADADVARVIQQDPSFSPQGGFQLDRYQQFRAAYRQRYGGDWEQEVRQNLATERLEKLAEICFDPWDQVVGEIDPALRRPSTWMLLAKWMDQFRERTEITLYRSPS